jgi:hypothetical protein
VKLIIEEHSDEPVEVRHIGFCCKVLHKIPFVDGSGEVYTCQVWWPSNVCAIIAVIDVAVAIVVVINDDVVAVAGAIVIAGVRLISCCVIIGEVLIYLILNAYYQLQESQMRGTSP